MPKKKRVKKNVLAPRTDANQNAQEHLNRVKKQNDYLIRKLAEYRAKQQLAAQQRKAIAEDRAGAGSIDGLSTADTLV